MAGTGFQTALITFYANTEIDSSAINENFQYLNITNIFSGNVILAPFPGGVVTFNSNGNTLGSVSSFSFAGGGTYNHGDSRGAPDAFLPCQNSGGGAANFTAYGATSTQVTMGETTAANSFTFNFKG